jgi:hypothetical protein
MEWIKVLIEKHTKDGQLDQEELIKDINTEFPKYAVPKEQYNALAEAKKRLDAGIAERDKQLEELKKKRIKLLQKNMKLNSRMSN